MPHEYQSAIAAYDNGKMDGFMVAENKDSNTMSYYDNNTIPYYWELAKHYVLADNFYSSVLSYILPKHWYAIAGQAPISSIYYSMPQNPETSADDEIQAAKYYLRASNAISTIAHFLYDNNTTNNNNDAISWKYYYHSIDPGDNIYTEAIRNGYAYDFWNPFAAKASIYSEEYAPHFVERGQIFSGLENGSLPNVSWLIPSDQLSEHPPNNITLEGC
jgi:phospholipase C